MNKYLIKSVQIIVHLLTSIPQRLFYGFKKSRNLILDKNTKYIIAANHPTRLDAFIVLAAMPFKEYIKILPVRFITAEKYMNKWYQKLYMVPLGCVSTEIKNKKPIEYYKELLEDKQTIFIFPRGKLDKKNDLGEAKAGVMVLEKDVEKSMIIPVKIEKMKNKKLSVEFKKIFRHKKFSKNLKKDSLELMEMIER